VTRIPKYVLFAALLANGCTFDSHLEGDSPDSAAAPSPAIDAGANPAWPVDEVSRPAFLEHPEPEVQVTIRAWRERHLIHGDVSSPDSARCIDELAALETVTVPADEFRRLCARCEPDDRTSPECEELGHANACAPIASLRGPDGELGEPQPLNVIARTHRDDTSHQHLVIHETIHHLGRCTGDGIDDGHTRIPYWCTGGDVCDAEEASRSINSRARAFLSERRDDE